MSEQSAVTKMPAGQGQPRYGETVIRGRIEKVRRNGDRWFHTLRMPAADQYESAPVVEVRSDKRLGSQGEEVTVECRISGWFGKPWTSPDGEKIVRVNMALDEL